VTETSTARGIDVRALLGPSLEHVKILPHGTIAKAHTYVFCRTLGLTLSLLRRCGYINEQTRCGSECGVLPLLDREPPRFALRDAVVLETFTYPT